MPSIQTYPTRLRLQQLYEGKHCQTVPGYCKKASNIIDFVWHAVGFLGSHKSSSNYWSDWCLLSGVKWETKVSPLILPSRKATPSICYHVKNFSTVPSPYALCSSLSWQEPILLWSQGVLINFTGRE